MGALEGVSPRVFSNLSSIDQSFLLSLDGFFGILNVNMQKIERELFFCTLQDGHIDLGRSDFNIRFP